MSAVGTEKQISHSKKWVVLVQQTQAQQVISEQDQAHRVPHDQCLIVNSQTEGMCFEAQPAVPDLNKALRSLQPFGRQHPHPQILSLLAFML